MNASQAPIGKVVPVVLSGGSGTRLWPRSRQDRPKQFLPLVTERSLLQDTVLRVGGLGARVAEPIVVCNADHRFLVAEQLRELDIAPGAVLLEPIGRNTAPAVAAAALSAVRAAGNGEDPILVVLPADHVILDAGAFCTAVESAIRAAAEGNLVAFGIVPDRPETGYGYIRRGAERGDWSDLDRFVEKPDLDTAERYVASGDYLWNSGMFVFSAKTYLAELDRHAPEMVAATRAAVAGADTDADFVRLGSAFFGCPSDSIDYAVMEKTDRAAVVALDAGWSDVGSWSALHEVLDKDEGGNVLRGTTITHACRNSYIESTSRPIAAIGLEDMIVVETDEAVLVMHASESQRIKQAVESMKAAADERPPAEPPAAANG